MRRLSTTMTGIGPLALIFYLLIGWTAGSARAALDPTTCGTCHATEAARAAATGGHAVVLDCGSCHGDRRQGRIGPRHRKVAPCGQCHETPGPASHPAAARVRGARRAARNCLTCHDVHGSPNDHLIREEIRKRGRVAAITFNSEAGAAPGGFTNPTDPGTGLCEVCHRNTDYYRRDGGMEHFGATCTICHDHGAHFGVVVTARSCGTCHAEETALLAKPSQHSALPCARCHAEADPKPGPGHQSAERCESCHADNATHAPAGHDPLPCTQCHNPHGSDNVQLMRDTITTPSGGSATIHYDNPFGRVEGSFASPSAPGTGICEVCHTQTQFYRADAQNQSHNDFSCLPCHLHANGFAPPPP